jgi:predicted kinase
MSKVIMYKGLPASGKSTEAKKLVAESNGKIKRVNKDDLRKMIDAGEWSGKNEKFILEIRDEIVRMCVVKGIDLIVDDTNFSPVHEEHLRSLTERWGGTFEINDSFCSVPIEECIKRDLKRPDSVGEKVIRDMARQYLEPKVEPVKYVEGLPEAVLVDVDGTVALMKDRSPYDMTRVGDDDVNEPVASVVRSVMDYRGKDMNLIFVSGRSEDAREATAKWLKDKVVDCSFKLFMRPDGNIEKDYIIKRRIYEENIKGKYNVWFVMDDRSQVVQKCWRALGLTCLQVDEGNF